jgi:WD40 repeat protein
MLIGHDGRVVRLAFHPHEDVIATCSWDQTVRVWDLTRPATPTHVAFSLSYQALEFTADGKRLWPGVNDGRLWTWEWMRPTVGEVVVSSRWDSLWGADMSPDGKALAGMSESGLEVWDVARPQRPVVLAPANPTSPEEFARLIDFGIDWNEVQVGARLRDVLAQKPLQPIGTLSGRRLRFSERGDELTYGTLGGVTRLNLRGDPDQTLRVTDRDTWPEPGGEEHAWSNDGTLLAVGPKSGSISVYDTATKQQVASVGRHGWSKLLSFSPDNRWLAAGSWPQSGVRVWDVSTGKAVAILNTSSSSQPTFSADGRWLVVGAGDGYQFYQTDGWKAAHQVRRVDCGHKPATAAFSQDGKLVAVWTRPGQVSLLNPNDGSEYAVLPITTRSGSIEANGELRFTADGSNLVVVADRKRIQVWNITSIRTQLAAVGLDWAPVRE